MKRLRRVDEPEVISEFLKNEFYHGEFHEDRGRFEKLVVNADITDERQNALRRALLFRRRGHMWRELPADTQWWEVQFEPGDLELIRVFPRAQWRRVSNGSYLLTDIAERIRTVAFSGKTGAFISKIQSLSDLLRHKKSAGSVLLIGIDETRPFTILEGNHRLTAALLVSPQLLSTHFTMFCGMSSNMGQSCWYETNFANLCRYAQNRFRNLIYDRDADLRRAVKGERPKSRLTQETALTEPALDTSVSVRKAIPGSK